MATLRPTRVLLHWNPFISIVPLSLSARRPEDQHEDLIGIAPESPLTLAGWAAEDQLLPRPWTVVGLGLRPVPVDPATVASEGVLLGELQEPDCVGVGDIPDDHPCLG